MGWKSDWLYQSIFRDIEDIWRRAANDATGAFGPAPDYLVVSQFADLSAESDEEIDPKRLAASFVPPVLTQWIFDDTGLRIIGDSNSDGAMKASDAIRGMFYTVGTVTFCISPDRTVVVIQYVLEPRYGAHRVFKVSGQGKRGKLEAHPDFVWWVS